MLYQSFVEQIHHLNFIHDETAADSALKAAIGILVSVMDDERARKLTQELPEPLDFATLRGYQEGAVKIPFDEAVTSLAVRLDLDPGEAYELLKKAIHCVKTSVNLDLVAELFTALPEDWKTVTLDA